MPLINKWGVLPSILRFWTMEIKTLSDGLGQAVIFFLCKYWFYQEGPICKGWPQEPRDIIFNPCWSGVNGKHLDHPNMRCNKQHWRHDCWYKNVYLQALYLDNHYILFGTEFWLEHIEKVALILKALYGRKSCGANFWKSLRSCMTHLVFISCNSDPDIWIHSAQKDYRLTYWDYIFLYMDDVLWIIQRAEHVFRNKIGKYVFLKEGSVYSTNNISWK